MAKVLLSMPELHQRALAEIRQQPGCRSVRDIAINRVTDGRAQTNWSLCVLSAGTADAHTAARAALDVQRVLRRDYDLVPVCAQRKGTLTYAVRGWAWDRLDPPCRNWRAADVKLSVRREVLQVSNKYP